VLVAVSDCLKYEEALRGVVRGEGSSLFSSTLLAELVVGRIIRSRKPLPGALMGSGGCAFCAVFNFGGGPIDDDVRLRDCESAAREVVLAIEVRLFATEIGRAGGDFPCFAAEDAVGATRCAGSLIGRVGDFGLGLTKPVALRVPVNFSAGFGLFPRLGAFGGGAFCPPRSDAGLLYVERRDLTTVVPALVGV
jgi:hypothetical protein